MQRFAMEIIELRELGFAEGLPIESSHDARGMVARLESGRFGVAVEFSVQEGAPTYALIPLLAKGGNARAVATNIWGDVVRDIHRHAPMSDE